MDITNTGEERGIVNAERTHCGNETSSKGKNGTRQGIPERIPGCAGGSRGRLNKAGNDTFCGIVRLLYCAPNCFSKNSLQGPFPPFSIRVSCSTLHRSMVILRTKLRCTPNDRCTPEHCRQIKTCNQHRSQDTPSAITITSPGHKPSNKSRNRKKQQWNKGTVSSRKSPT